MHTTRVILVDDHSAVRSGIRRLLARADGMEVVGEATNGVEALRLVDDLHPDVMLLDIEMPIMDGFEVARRLKKKKKSVRVLILSAHDDREFVQQLLSLGVFGYLIKEDVPEVLINAVRGIARGEKGWLSPRIAKQFQ